MWQFKSRKERKRDEKNEITWESQSRVEKRKDNGVKKKQDKSTKTRK